MGEIKKVIEKYINDGLPKLFVFDLDYTLWPFWVDTHVQPPFVKDKHGRVSDAYRQEIKLYPGVREILDNLKHFQCQIAAASRTDTPKAARDLMSLIGIDHHFDFKEIYPGKKIKHFQKFRENSGIDYHEMVFFDDEHRNIADISKLGVTCVLVKEGLSAKYLEEALLSFRKKLYENQAVNLEIDFRQKKFKENVVLYKMSFLSAGNLVLVDSDASNRHRTGDKLMGF